MPTAEITTIGPALAAPTPTNKPHTPASSASAAGTTASPVSALSMGTRTPTSAASKKSSSKAHTFGVLKTGTLQKMNPNKSFDKPKKRFVILTSVAIHWFKREDGYDLFGEERGNINIQDISKVEIYAASSSSSSISSGGDGAQAGDSFEVSCKQDVVRRIFRASSPEEAQGWVLALKNAIKARSLYRRETLTGLNFLPGGHGGHEQEAPPLVSVVTLKKGGGGEGGGEEVVLAKAPEYHYGTLVSVPFFVAPAAAAGPSYSSSSSTAMTPRTQAANNTLCILLSNGDSAEVSVQSLSERPVGSTVPVRVTSLSGHAANLPLTIEAVSEARPTAAAAAAAAAAVAQKPILPMDVLLPAVFAVLLAVWTGVELKLKSSSSSSSSSLTGDRLVLMAFVGLAFLRVLWEKQQEKKQASTQASNTPKAMIMKVSIDDYQLSGEGEGEEDPFAIPPIPERFVNGCFGDMVEAERRWRITLAWRNEFGTDGILEREHPMFDIVKQSLPAFYCGTAKDGNPVYYERSGQTDLGKAKQCGIDWMVYNYVHSTEFVFNVLHPRETAKTVTIFDVDGLSLGSVAGEPLEFIRRASHVMQEHYPERCRVIIICNCPGWFSFVWKMIRPLVNETTQKKVKIVSKAGTFDAINEFVEADQIPVEYGGTLRFGDGEDSCRWHCPEEVKLREHVYAVNKRFKEERAARGEPEPVGMQPTYR